MTNQDFSIPPVLEIPKIVLLTFVHIHIRRPTQDPYDAGRFYMFHLSSLGRLRLYSWALWGSYLHGVYHLGHPGPTGTTDSFLIISDLPRQE